ncbi:EF-hand domain-containing D1 [Brachionus plicatilis]|uniref:EF-hand domain-containing D1 n=1 Tax=Brachionus plicatilis TaxID=10195 RepID=A0A3M7P3V5_BRAPC|nr:EF-hand domain-containing D1 [Brachionus plicatilis]
MIEVKLFLSLLIIQNVFGQCPLVPSQGSDPIPSIPSKFQTRVEVNTESQMTEFRYFYNYDQRRAAIETRKSNNYQKLIFNYDTDEIYELNNKIDFVSDPLHWPPDGRPEFPTTCTTYKLSNTSRLNYYFGFTSSGGSILPAVPAQIFNFFPITYAGKDNIRGIPCDVYKSCAKDPSTNADFVITHYFSDKSFTLAGGDQTFNRLPIRAVYEQKIDVEDAPEILSFIEWPHTFDTPSSVYCSNRKATKQVPSIQIAFGFSQEITSNSQIQYVKDFYTFDNFSRYEIRNPRKEEATFYTQDPVVYISELSAGIQYGINQRHGNCSVRGIKSDTIYIPKLNQTFNSLLDFLAQIQSTQSFLSFDSEFIYTGQKFSNGISSDRFITNKTSGIYEYTFSDEDYVVFNNYESETRVPLSLYIDNKQSKLSSHSSFFNFETLPPSNILRLFDISSCFYQNETIDFDIVFQYRGIVLPEDILNEKQLDIVMYGLLNDLTRESTIRFKSPIISVSSDGNLYVRSGIFPLPHPITFFTFIERTLIYGSSLAYFYNLRDVEECAEKCFNNEKCLSFDFSSGRSCYLYNRTVTDGSSSSSSYFDHYTMLSQSLIFDILKEPKKKRFFHLNCMQFQSQKH